MSYVSQARVRMNEETGQGMSGIREILRPEDVFCDVSCESKKRLLDIAAEGISKAHKPVSQSVVFDRLCARERLGSTGLGNGIALPHGRLPEPRPVTGESGTSPFSSANGNVLTAFFTLQHPIDYGSDDQRPVDIVFVLITPEQSTDEHLRILALLASVLRRTELADALRGCKSPAALYQLLVEG